MRPVEDIEAEAYDDAKLDVLAKKGRAGADFALAVRTARGVCEDAGLNAEFHEDGNWAFTANQTGKAVRHTREDVSASLMLQLFIMQRLDRNRNFMVAIIVLLVYIASQLK